MRPMIITKGALGASDWKKIDPHKIAFGAGFGVTLSAAGSLTYSVQHSFDDIDANIPCNFSRTTTALTITFPSAHGLTTSDSVVLSGLSGSTNLVGNFAVTTVSSPTSIIVTVTNAGATAGVINASPMRVFNHSVVASQTVAKDGNYAYPIFAFRLNVTAYTSGVATMTLIEQGVK